MKDLTPQEAVKEARKIVGDRKAVVWVAYYSDEEHRSPVFMRVAWGSRAFSFEGRTIRSCLAKLKKEVGK